MRSFPILLLTTAYFGVALTSYSQVSAEDRTAAGPNGETCRVVGRDEAKAMNIGPGLSSSVTVGDGAGSASTSVGTTGSTAAGSGVTVHSGSGGTSSSASVTTADGRTVVTMSDGTCVVVDNH